MKLVQKAVKEFVSAEGCSTSADVLTKLEQKLNFILKEGCERAKGNGRKTLRALDL